MAISLQKKFSAFISKFVVEKFEGRFDKMPLLGEGVAAIWHNVAPEVQDDYNHWHCYEHVPERVSIKGFLRGRRYVAIEGEPEFFHFYETETVATSVMTI